MLSFLYVYSDHSILECYNLFSGVELSMRSFLLLLLLLLLDEFVYQSVPSMTIPLGQPPEEGGVMLGSD